MAYYALFYQVVDDFIARRAAFRDEHLHLGRGVRLRCSRASGPRTLLPRSPIPISIISSKPCSPSSASSTGSSAPPSAPVRFLGPSKSWSSPTGNPSPPSTPLPDLTTNPPSSPLKPPPSSPTLTSASATTKCRSVSSRRIPDLEIFGPNLKRFASRPHYFQRIQLLGSVMFRRSRSGSSRRRSSDHSFADTRLLTAIIPPLLSLPSGFWCLIHDLCALSHS